MKKQNLFKIMAISVIILPTVLLQAQSSQAIPLDGILDSAGKSFIQNLFGIAPAPKPAEPEPAAAEPENTGMPAETNNLEGEANSNNQ
jgi:hypothetical protein